MIRTHRHGVRIAVVTMAAVTLATAWSSAQVPRDTGATQPPASAAVRTATVRVTGRVVEPSGTPVRRAILTLSGGGLARSRSVISGEDGGYVFEALPAGRFTLTAAKPAYITTAYGAKRPGLSGTALELVAGQQVTNVVVTLTRGAVIAGRVTDQNGEPMAGANIALIRARRMTLVTQVAPTPFPPVQPEFTTDDRGVYRIYGLEPGAYFVAAGVRFSGTSQMAMLSEIQMEVARQEQERRRAALTPARGQAAPPPANSAATPRMFAIPAVFYPSGSHVGEATAVTVQAGDERQGVDITLKLVPTATVAGTIVGGGAPMPPVQLGLNPPVSAPLPVFFSASLGLAGAPGPDGAFRYANVAPGRYTLTVRTMAQGARGAGINVVSVGGGGATSFTRGGGGAAAGSAAPGSPPGLWASAEVFVTGDDINGITLALAPMPRVKGRVVFDSSTHPGRPDRSPTTALRVTLGVPGGEGNVVMNGTLLGRPQSTTAVAADDTFELTNVVPGNYRFSVAGLPAGWWVRSAVMNGRDVLDSSVDVPASGGDVSEVVVTVTDRRTELAGTLQTPAGSPATEYFVILVTTDPSLWHFGARRLLSTRPATNGSFFVRDFPAGEYYVAALSDLDPDEWQTPEFLNQVVPAAIRLTIADGDRRRQDLRIAR